MRARRKDRGDGRREKGAFLCVIALAAFLAVAICLLIFLPEKKEGGEIVSSVMTETDASPLPEREADGTAASLPEREEDSAATSLPEKGEEDAPPSFIRITDLPDEALTLLRCTEGQLAREMKEYLNASGFADVAEVAYEGETVISHGDNSVSVCFSLEREGEAYEVCCIYGRDGGCRTMAIWD